MSRSSLLAPPPVQAEHFTHTRGRGHNAARWTAGGTDLCRKLRELRILPGDCPLCFLQEGARLVVGFTLLEALDHVCCLDACQTTAVAGQYAGQASNAVRRWLGACSVAADHRQGAHTRKSCKSSQIYRLSSPLRRPARQRQTFSTGPARTRLHLPASRIQACTGVFSRVALPP